MEHVVAQQDFMEHTVTSHAHLVSMVQTACHLVVVTHQLQTAVTRRLVHADVYLDGMVSNVIFHAIKDLGGPIVISHVSVSTVLVIQ